MKNKYIFLILLLTTFSCFAQEFKIVSGIEKNEKFVSIDNFTDNELKIIKTFDYNVFYEIYSTDLKSENYFVSFQKIKVKDVDYILKCTYDKKNSVKNISISSKLKKETEELVLTQQNKSNVNSKPCTRYNYDVWDCIKHIIGL